MTSFTKESDFEAAVIAELTRRGWAEQVIKNPTEQDLLDNWASILFENNRGIDRLNDVPLTQGEMQQIMEQIHGLRTPLKLNGFINGKTVTITRDNPADALHFGKEVSLKIYDRHEIAGGQSRYQIVQQPQFKRAHELARDRRGDLMLLINGMPVFHIELKRSGVPVSQAYNQIQTYSREGVFSGLFSLVQIFVAMEPNEALYFANPGPDGKFNRDFAFHWADFNNEPINHWSKVVEHLLSIPMAHQLIGFYTVADEADGVLKVLRSYQYYAAHAISDTVAKTNWQNPNRLGGFIWHTTGSGKTMTSFKSAQLIAGSRDADKVVFVLDRIELGAQTLAAYKNFVGDSGSVQATEHTGVLVSKLKSKVPADTLIVTSIQKLSRLKDEEDGLNSNNLEAIRKKRLVFIVDECHRSTFGDMLQDIKDSFKGALFFGFTGTPIQQENRQKDSTTVDVFGNELHRYSIADGIRDKNVLGFDPYQVATFKDRDVREAIALEQAKAGSVAEVMDDARKKRIFNRFMQDVPMAGTQDEAGKHHKGIEDYLPMTQYDTPQHREAVVEDIADNWPVLSQGNRFYAIFATHSIAQAIHYYRLIKNWQQEGKFPALNLTALFDPHDNLEGRETDRALKQSGLLEILQDYNQCFQTKFDLANHAGFKKDLANRLARKTPYTHIDDDLRKPLHLLIVVDQMLTGFDSKWINTLYLDKLMDYENIIQAFSRTNRLFGPDKPFGTIRYYRKPHTMTRNVADAVKLYSGDKPIGLFVCRLADHVAQMNQCFAEIQAIFTAEKTDDFKALPENKAARQAFAKAFNQLQGLLEAAKVQGFSWEVTEYHREEEQNGSVTLELDQQQYVTLLQRYKELSSGSTASGDGGDEPSVYDLSSHITEIDTDKIDSDYMNSRFDKYLKELKGHDPAAQEAALAELQRSFASLSQDEQRYAELLLNDFLRGDVETKDGYSFRDYLTDYQANLGAQQIRAMVEYLGVDEKLLTGFMNTRVTPANINDYGRFDELLASVDRQKARQFFELREGTSVKPYQVSMKVDALLRDFVLQGRGVVESFDFPASYSSS